ncbi:MAG: sigma-70 family RNA polymerase sigma factor [Lachnospiraceae bacterium]|nr:sigma-70 family RNA polymerase sigma factor [Lachnospiraceae bacterium]
MQLQEKQETERIIRQYSNLVYRIAYAQLKNRSDADDIYQEVFYRYIRKTPTFRSEEHGKAWFIKVTVNCCRKHWASAWYRKTEGLGESVESLPLSGDDQRQRVFAQDMDQHLMADEEAVKIWAAVNALPENYRIVVHLFYYEKMTIQEISKALKRRASTVRTQLTRARGRLRGVLQEEFKE